MVVAFAGHGQQHPDPVSKVDAPYFVPVGKGGRLVSIESDGPDCPHDQAETTARVDVVADWIASHIG